MGLTYQLDDLATTHVDQVILDRLSEVYGALLAGREGIVEVECVDATTMQARNKEYRDIDEVTDVLSFPNFEGLEAMKTTQMPDPLLIGNITVCPERAEMYGETIMELVHHGSMHLLGYDHEVDEPGWDREEGAILKKAFGTVRPIRTRVELLQPTR